MNEGLSRASVKVLFRESFYFAFKSLYLLHFEARNRSFESELMTVRKPILAYGSNQLLYPFQLLNARLLLLE